MTLASGFLGNSYIWFLLLVFSGIGFLGALYYEEHPVRFDEHIYSTTEILRNRQISHRLRMVEYRNAYLEYQIAELNIKFSEPYGNSDYSKIHKLLRFVGFVQQEGEGVEIALKDTSKPLLLGENPNTGIIHNTDLLEVVNELRAAGVRAISINNQPIMNLSAISCYGPIIIINESRITSPFVIKAVGNPERIISHLERDNSFIKELKRSGIEVAITPKNVVIPGSGY